MTIKNNNYIIALLITMTTFNGYCMDEPEQDKKTAKKIPWIKVAKEALLGNFKNIPILLQQSSPETTTNEPLGLSNLPETTTNEPLGLSSLPEETHKEIILFISLYSHATSIEQAADAIKYLSHINKQFNLLINEPQFCLKLIKYLSHRFEYADNYACSTLNTLGATKQLHLQNTLKMMCSNPTTSKEDFENLCKKGVDLEFTYEIMGGLYTPLLLCIEHSNLPVMHMLLEKNVSVNTPLPDGRTPLMIATGKFTAKSLTIVALLAQKIKSNNDNINLQDNNGDTALMYAIYKSPDKVAAILAAGADPEIPDYENITPLDMAEGWGRPAAIISLLKEAIAKKSLLHNQYKM